ncbi:hypothetical protein EAF00_007886 [Botryotinia globosa]|nr:hypothetical protein EAF00_007886 [Botryotinia globosa]
MTVTSYYCVGTYRFVSVNNQSNEKNLENPVFVALNLDCSFQIRSIRELEKGNSKATKANQGRKSCFTALTTAGMVQDF